MQDIGVTGEFKNCVATKLVVSKLLNLPDAARACVDFCVRLMFSISCNYHIEVVCQIVLYCLKTKIF